MIDEDGIKRPDNPHAHMRKTRIVTLDREITESYPFVSNNIFFKLWAAILRRCGIIFLGPYIKHKYRLKIIGKINTKTVKKQGVIVTINHVHDFDNLLVATRILKHRKCYFLTLKSNINMRGIGYILKLAGGIPIPTNIRAIMTFGKSVEKLLKNKKAIMVCPEASLWPYYRGIRPFKKGAFYFAVKSEVPVLPVVILFRQKAKKHSHSKKNKFKYYFTVKVGKPLYPDTTLSNKHKRIDELHSRTYNFYKDTIETFYKKKKED